MDTLLQTLAQAQPQSTADIINDLARTPLSQVVKFIAILSLVRVILYPLLKNTPVHKRGALFGFARVVNEILDAFIYAGAFVFLIIRPFALQTFRIPSGSMWPTLYVHDFIVANKAIYRYTDPKSGDIVVFRPPVDATEQNPSQRDPNGEVNVDFIKRCIGTPGQIVELREGILYRDGVRQEEPYKHFSNTRDNVNFEDISQDQLDNQTKASFKMVKFNGEVMPFNYTAYDGNSSRPRGAGFEPEPYVRVASKFIIDDPTIARQLMAQKPQPIPAGYYLMLGDNRNGSLDGRAWGLVPRDSIIGRSEFIWLPISRWGRTK